MSSSPSPIVELDAPALRARHDALVALLADAVDDNASVGYVLPHAHDRYAAAWDAWIGDVERDGRIVLAALAGDDVAGCVHLAPCPKPNQPHRADVQKLLVHRRHRQRGLGRALMRAVEVRALSLGRTLLLLDTRTASPAESLYRREGWTPFGIVPGFALDPDGTPADCTFFWKRLEPRAAAHATGPAAGAAR
jgi:GNAT superfamily N-acetyltransferase